MEFAMTRSRASVRRRLISVVGAVVLGASVLVGCESAVTAEAFDQVKVGMTMPEVEKLLGGSGTEDTSPAGLEISGAGAPSTKKASSDKTYVWKGDGVTVIVVFADGKVVQKTKK